MTKGQIVMLIKCMIVWPAMGMCALGSGCASGAFVDLSASQALQTIAAEMRTTVEEYRADLATADDQRESVAIQAFIARVRNAEGDQASLDEDGAALAAALAKIRADRAAAVERYVTALANIDVLAETADGLKHYGLARLSLGRSIQDLLTVKE